jgi:quercetin dioxygenase-like cupin family protein
MQRYAWNTIQKEELNPRFARQAIHTDTMTVAKVFLKKGYVVPEHSHPNEQVSIMEEGVLRFLFGDEEVVLRAGETLRIPANVPHSAEALEDSVGIDIFSPPRLDWISGDDAYLRR